MANSLSNIKRESFEAFEEALAQGTALFERCGPVLMNDEATLTITENYSGGGFTAYSAVGTSVTQDILSGKVSHTSTAYAKDEKITFKDIRDNPELPAQRARSLANRAMANLNAQFFAGLEALFATTHPLAGGGTGQVGAGKNYLDTALVYSGGTQSNLTTAALSRAALLGARQTFRNWKSIGDGTALNLGQDGSNLCIVCGPANEETAIQAVTANVTSDQMQTNLLQGWGDVVVYPFATDEDDWFVIDRSIGPCGMWIRQMPQISIMPDSSTAGRDLVMGVTYIADFWYDVEGAGIYGSNVA